MMCMGWNPLKTCGAKSACQGLWFWAGLVVAALLGAQKHKGGAK